MIYLDHNSTSPIDPRVIETIAATLKEGYLNPASQHRLGQRARKQLETLRESIVQMLGGETQGMSADTLIFTSGGTESNNLALLGLSAQAKANSDAEDPPEVFISSIEHPSIVGAAETLARNGFTVVHLPVDQNGTLTVPAVEERLSKSKNPVLVSVMMANNETGVIQPMGKVADICKKHDVLLHTDAVQCVGKLPVDFSQLGVDAMSLTAHKLQGPRGIGGLLLRHGLTVEPILFGGFQQMAMRPGTEDVALAAGLEHALRIAQQDSDRAARMTRLRDQLEKELLKAHSNLMINGHQAPRLPHTSNLSFRGIDRQALLLAADMNDLAISTGSACASGSSEPSPVLLAMNLDDEIVKGSIRVSLGPTTTKAEIDEAINRISRIVENLSA